MNVDEMVKAGEVIARDAADRMVKAYADQIRRHHEDYSRPEYGGVTVDDFYAWLEGYTWPEGEVT